MTTTLGAPIVIKAIDWPCNGPCNGTIEVTTDEVHAAYAVTTETSVRYIEQDALGVERQADGTIVVSCGAVHERTGVRCDGGATFTKAVLNAQPWQALNDRASLMTPMEH